MEDMKFLDVARNPHFAQFVTMLSVPYSSIQWREEHPKVPFWVLIKNITKLMHDGGLADKNARRQFIDEFVTLITKVTEADPDLHYRTEDMNWFTDVLSGEYAAVTMSMLFAYASSRASYLTPVQVAEITGKSESHWRNKAAEGDIMGAFKAGKQWLIPVMSLRAEGIAVDMRGQTFDEYSKENEE